MKQSGSYSRTDSQRNTGAERERKAATVIGSSAAGSANWRNIRLIVGNEYSNRVGQRSFAISSIALLVVVAIAGFVPTITQYITTRTDAQTRVAVLNGAGAIAGLHEATLAAYIGTALNGSYSEARAPYAIAVRSPAQQESLRSQVRDGSLGILLSLTRGANQELQFTYFTNADPTRDGYLPGIQALATQLTFLDTANRLGLTQSQTVRLLDPPILTVERTQPDRPANELIAGYVFAFAGGFLMYMAVMLYANTVATGVAEEKGSRVMELLVNAATPLQLMIGKIVGIGAACLTQMAALVGVGICTLLIQAPLQKALFGPSAGGFAQYLTGRSIPFYLLFLLYFLLSFILNASIYAGLGALVRRPEEVPNAVLVPIVLSVTSFLAVYLGAFFPDAGYVKALSYVPFFSPTLMLVRLALGTVAWWEVLLTAALMLATAGACAWFSARLYRYGVLMYGQRPKLSQMLKIVRAG